MAYQHYRSQFGDTTYTKVFVGGLAWETPTHEMQRYFQQFGEILEAVIITDKNTGRSKGYGFVTFLDPESARRACIDPNPVIDGRRTNCNIASFGRPRASPPRGRNQGGNSYRGGAPLGATSYNRAAGPPPPPLPPPPPPPPPPPVIYPPYGYTTYAPDYVYPQTVYSPHLQTQYYHPVYGTSSSTTGYHPYYYGYASPAASSRETFLVPQAHRSNQGPSYLYPTTRHGEVSFATFPPPAPTRPPVSLSTTDSQTTQQTSASTGVGATGSESTDTREKSS